jgi:hypothetical protein
VPPPSTREADDIDLAIKTMAARRRRTMIGLALGAVLLVASPYLFIAYGMHRQWTAEDDAKRAEQLNDSEQKEMNDLLSRADAALAAQDTAFRNATSKAALDAIQVGEGNCSDSPSAPTGPAADSYLRYGSIDGNYFGNAAFTLVTNDDVSKASPVAYARDVIDRIRTANTGHSATKTDLEDARDIVNGSRRSSTIFIVPEDQKEPDVTFSDGTFTPGFLRGRAYLVRDDTHRISCVGDLDVHNSPTVDVTYFTTTISGVPIAGSMAQLEGERAGVKRDLELQIRRALATDLHDAQ